MQVYRADLPISGVPQDRYAERYLQVVEGGFDLASLVRTVMMIMGKGTPRVIIAFRELIKR